MTSPTAATPASEDIAKMLDRLEYVCDGHKHDADICECRSLARSRILDLFARLRSDNERQAEALEMFRDEQQRDKANLLTPEEAHHALDQIPDNQCGWPPEDCPVCDSLREKLRRQSDTGAKE